MRSAAATMLWGWGGGRAGPGGGGEARPGGGERYSVAWVGVGATTPARISRDEAGARLSRCAGTREQVRARLAGLCAPRLAWLVASCGFGGLEGAGNPTLMAFPELGLVGGDDYLGLI